MNEDDLQEALMPGGKPAPVDEIRITIEGRQRFRWSLWRAGKEIFAGDGDASEISGMIRTTQIIVETGLRVPPDAQRPEMN